MADNAEPLSPEEHKRVIDLFEAHLKEKWKAGVCPICKETDWHIYGDAQIHTYGKGEWGGGGRHYALGVVSCGNCGYIVLMSLQGLLPDELRSVPKPPPDVPEVGDEP